MTPVMVEVPLVSVNGVSKLFSPSRPLHEIVSRPWGRPPSVAALEDVSFRIGRGRLVGLFGPNGAGKTTLLKILAGLLLPDQGRVRIAGRSAQENPLFIKKNIGLVVSQERSFFWRLTGRQNLSFFAALYGLDAQTSRRRLDRLLEDLRVEDPDKRFDAYSAGTKQKIAFIRALVHDPPLLLLDEPFTNLDVLTRRFLKELLQDKLVAKEKRTVLLATHEIAGCAPLCDTFLCLKNGKVCFDGTPQDLRRREEKTGPETQDLLLDILAGTGGDG